MAFAADVQYSPLYYKSQIIVKEKLPYNVSGLGYAILKGKIELVDTYLKAGMSPNETYMTVPMTILAIAYKQPECLQLLLDNGAKLDDSLLVYSINYRNSECVDVLLKNGVDPNKLYRGYYPLNYAIKKKEGKIVNSLLLSGARPNDTTVKLIAKSKNEQLKLSVLNYIK